jgi:hypothetical protein
MSGVQLSNVALLRVWHQATEVVDGRNAVSVILEFNRETVV